MLLFATKLNALMKEIALKSKPDECQFNIDIQCNQPLAK